MKASKPGGDDAATFEQYMSMIRSLIRDRKPLPPYLARWLYEVFCQQREELHILIQQREVSRLEGKVRSSLLESR